MLRLELPSELLEFGSPCLAVVALLAALVPNLASVVRHSVAAPSEVVEPTVEVDRLVASGSIVELGLPLPTDVPMTCWKLAPSKMRLLVEASGSTDQVAPASHVVVDTASPWILEGPSSIHAKQKVRSEPSLAGFRSHERSLRKFLPRSASVQRCTVAPRSRGDAKVLRPLELLRLLVLNDGGGDAARSRSP